jgi:hypothetical protein
VTGRTPPVTLAGVNQPDDPYQPYRPPPPPPWPAPQPVVQGKGFNGPYAWLYITVLVVAILALPLVCCLGLMIVGYSGT